MTRPLWVACIGTDDTSFEMQKLVCSMNVGFQNDLMSVCKVQPSSQRCAIFHVKVIHCHHDLLNFSVRGRIEPTKCMKILRSGPPDRRFSSRQMPPHWKRMCNIWQMGEECSMHGEDMKCIHSSIFIKKNPPISPGCLRTVTIEILWCWS
jgi:hypothetical protein